MNTLAEERLVCRALCCTRPVYFEARCKLHYQRLCEREEYAAREEELAAAKAAKALAPVEEKPRCSVRGCDRVSAAFGLCAQHRSRQRRGVKLDAPIRSWGRG